MSLSTTTLHNPTTKNKDTHKYSFNFSELLKIDSYLSPFLDEINGRHANYLQVKKSLTQNNKISLTEFSRDGYKSYGFTIDQESKIISLTEWAPNADEIFLRGEFNAWNEGSHKLSKVTEYGHFQIIIPSVKIKGTKELAIPHDSKIRILLVLSSGEKI